MKPQISKGTTTMRLAKRELRTAIETDPDPIVQRIAQGMETVLRWATEHTVGWQRPAEEARALATILREELRLPSSAAGDADNLTKEKS